MRGKEEAHDYRYFPDPDLPPLVIADALVTDLRNTLPELADSKRARWQKDLGLTAADAQVLTAHPRIAEFFDETVALFAQGKPNNETAQHGKRVANFVQAEVLRHTKTAGLEASFPVTPTQVVELLLLVEDGTISGKMAKDVFASMLQSGKGASSIVKDQGLIQVTDTATIEAEITTILNANPEKVAQYKAGKTSLLGFFVGQVMRATQGSANPKLVNDVLKRLLDG